MKTSYGVLTKSDRAIIAEADGKVTYSKLNAWQKRAVDSGAVAPCEWHHTGAAARETNYYDPADFFELSADMFPPVKVERVEQADMSRLRISIVYEKAVSGFTKAARHGMKFETVTVEGTPDIRKKDGLITGVGGRRLDSNNTSIVFNYLPPRCRKWREITLEDAEKAGYRFA